MNIISNLVTLIDTYGRIFEKLNTLIKAKKYKEAGLLLENAQALTGKIFQIPDSVHFNSKTFWQKLNWVIKNWSVLFNSANDASILIDKFKLENL